MKRLSFAVLLALYGPHAFADSQAVRAVNYQLAYASGDTNTSGGSDSRTNGINGGVTFPLATYLGASVSGAYAHSTLATNFPNGTNVLTLASTAPHCTVNSKDLDAGLFVRDPTIGRIGVSYGLGRAKSNCDASFVVTGTDTLDTRVYAVGAEYYFPKVTIALSRTQTRFDPVNKFDSDVLTGSWYPTNILRVALSAEGMSMKNTYSLGLEYQPEFLDNSSGLSISYSTRHQTVTSHIVMVGLVYYFGERTDLLTRDREYR